MANTSEEDIAAIEKQANKGDAEAMFLLANVVKPGADGKQNLEFSRQWLEKAQAAGHPVALFRRAKREMLAHTLSKKDYLEAVGRPPPEEPIRAEDYLALAEKAARDHGGDDIAYELGKAYENYDAPPYAFEFLKNKGDPEKALYWTRLAADRGNVAAAEDLCAVYYQPNHRVSASQDYIQARRWCVVAAQASCSHHAPYYLSKMFRDGLGGPRNHLDARYWKKISDQREVIIRSYR